MSQINWINGSTGFIGSRFLLKLKKNKEKILILKRGFELSCYPNNEKFNLESLNESPDYFFCFATNFNPNAKSLEEVKSVFDANYFFNVECLDKFVAAGGKKLIYTSSYQQLLKKEYQNHYSISKEAFLKHAKSMNIDVLNFYLFDSFGAGDKRNKVLDRCIQSALKDQDIVIPKNQVKINLANSNEIIETIMHFNRKGFHGSYLLKSPYTITLEELANIVINLTNSKSTIKKDLAGACLFSKISSRLDILYREEENFSLENSILEKIKSDYGLQ